MNFKCVVVVFAATLCAAQENTATITRQVQDSSGTGIVGATITARNTQTGLERKVVTNDGATYTLPLLPIGNYDQFPMDAIISATARAAEALRLSVVDIIAPGFRADLVATDGNPLDDIAIVRRVVFVMRAGKIFRYQPAPSR